MKRLFLVPILLFSSLFALAQSQDYQWWNTIHGWQTGMPGWRMWLILSPKYLGPNALPVPELKNGIIPRKGDLEFGADFHFRPGDPTQDLSGRFLLPFAHSKIALELYGFIVEKYQMSNAIRDERFARDEDGKGITQGDFYFSTLIQLTKDRKFPNALLRMACKTSSGGAYYAARVTDSPAYFFDLDISKDIKNKAGTIIRPMGMIGFYSWQTNDELNLQDDALLYGAGFECPRKSWLFSSSLTGYYGYKNNGDRPMVLNIDLKKNLGKKTLRVRYLHGFHDWEYNTVKISLIWYFNGID